jgi:predicted aspartyl protease
MYVIGNVKGTQIKWLIDTGATVTLLAKRVFDEIEKTYKILTTEEVQDIMTAEGKPLKLYGTVTLDVVVGSSKYQRKVIIADITVDGILGLDFMNENQTVLNISEKMLTINGESHHLKLESKLGCYRMVSAESFVVPPRSEMVAFCDVCVPTGESLPT